MHSDREIDHLEDVLSNIEVMPDAMCISELDGYVAGLLLCPEMIMPSEWLPEVWNMDSEPEFMSVEQAQDTIGAVMAHYNRVAGNLAQRSQAYEILLEQAEGEDTPFWEFWVSGFEQAMRFRPNAWKAYETCDDEDAATAFALMQSLIDLSSKHSHLPKAEQEKLEENAPDLIPTAIMAMNDWLKSNQIPSFNSGRNFNWFDAANEPGKPAVSVKVGRNELCTCGSGRKYKKCCGAN